MYIFYIAFSVLIEKIILSITNITNMHHNDMHPSVDGIFLDNNVMAGFEYSDKIFNIDTIGQCIKPVSQSYSHKTQRLL